MNTQSYDKRAAIEVDFEQRGTSGRRWSAVFDLGNETENSCKALEIAWNHNAAIVGSRVLS